MSLRSSNGLLETSFKATVRILPMNAAGNDAKKGLNCKMGGKLSCQVLYMLCIEIFCIFSCGTKRITCRQLLTNKQVVGQALSNGSGDREKEEKPEGKKAHFLVIIECLKPWFLTVIQVSGKER